VGILCADRAKNQRDIASQSVPPYFPNQSKTVKKGSACRNLFTEAGTHTDASVNEAPTPLNGFDECGPHFGIWEVPSTIHWLVRTETFQMTNDPSHHAPPLAGGGCIGSNQVFEGRLIVTP
jgi:hypothetical protein